MRSGQGIGLETYDSHSRMILMESNKRGPESSELIVWNYIFVPAAINWKMNDVRICNLKLHEP